MSDDELPELLLKLEARIPDGDFRSHALEHLLEMRMVWSHYTVTQWVSWCRMSAWRAQHRHRTRVQRWGARARTRTLPHRQTKDHYTPLRRLELKEEVARRGSHN